MDKKTDRDLDYRDGEQGATSQAVASLNEIARELRELADHLAELRKQPLFQPTYH